MFSARSDVPEEIFSARSDVHEIMFSARSYVHEERFSEYQNVNGETFSARSFMFLKKGSVKKPIYTKIRNDSVQEYVHCP